MGTYQTHSSYMSLTLFHIRLLRIISFFKNAASYCNSVNVLPIDKTFCCFLLLALTYGPFAFLLWELFVHV